MVLKSGLRGCHTVNQGRSFRNKSDVIPSGPILPQSSVERINITLSEGFKFIMLARMSACSGIGLLRLVYMALYVYIHLFVLNKFAYEYISSLQDFSDTSAVSKPLHVTIKENKNISRDFLTKAVSVMVFGLS